MLDGKKCEFRGGERNGTGKGQKGDVEFEKGCTVRPEYLRLSQCFLIYINCVITKFVHNSVWK